MDKQIKKINIKIPENLNEIQSDIELIINKNEIIISKYLERHIYTSTISDINKKKIEELFMKNRNIILTIFS
jgi:hypothetical protein